MDMPLGGYGVREVSAVLLMLVCGCSGGGAGLPGPAPGAAIEQRESPPRAVTSHDEETLHRAKELLLRDCMRRQGFTTWLTPPKSPLSEDVTFPYAITDVGWARRHGYGSGLRDRIAELRKTDPNWRYFQGLSPERRAAALTALNGVRAHGLEARLPTGGVVRRSDSSCTSQAERQLYGDLKTWYRVEKVTGSLESLRVGKVMADTRFAGAVRRWSACMRARGHPYADPAQARSDALQAPGKEIPVAVAEATCATDAGLTAAVHRLEAQYKRDIDQQYRVDLTTKRELQRAALPRATAVIAAH